MQVVQIDDLPAPASAAAAHFHALWLPRIVADHRGQDLLLMFPAGGPAETGWRLAAVQSLARERAPLRINAIAGGNAQSRAAAVAYLAAAPGLTGQYLPLDDAGAGPVVQATP